VAAAAVRDAAVSFRGEEVHLVFLVVTVQGSTVGECYHETCWVSLVWVVEVGFEVVCGVV
jgi:hypothetical protein